MLPTAEIDPRIRVNCRPGHSEPGDVHVVRGHIKDVIRLCIRGHSHHIRALACKRDPLVHVYVLAVAGVVVHIDCVTSRCIVDCMLYRRAACIEISGGIPPAGPVDAHVADTCECRCQSRQYADCKIAATTIKTAVLHHRPVLLLRAFIVPLHCLQSGCLLRCRLVAQACSCCEECQMCYRSVYTSVGPVWWCVWISRVNPLPCLFGQEGFTHKSQVDHTHPDLSLLWFKRMVKVSAARGIACQSAAVRIMDFASTCDKCSRFYAGIRGGQLPSSFGDEIRPARSHR